MSAVAPVGALECLPTAQRDAKIMVLCDRAMVNLREARSIEAVVAIRNAADAFAHYARKMKAAVEAKNECELVVLLAEARIGAELRAAQERGEVATDGRPKTVSDGNGFAPATAADIGFTRKQSMVAKRLAAAGEPAIRDEVRRATEEGRRPSKRNLIAAIPSIAQRPPELTQMTLWLRTGAALAEHFGTGAAVIAAARQHAMTIDTDAAERIGALLNGMRNANHVQ